MYKDTPWTLKKDPNKGKKRGKNALTLTEEFLKKNKTQSFSSPEIAEQIGRGRVSASIALSQLRESGKIKIVKMEESYSNVLVAKYQHKSGPNKALHVIELENERDNGLITPKMFMDEYDVINEVKFRYKIENSNLPKYLIKTNSTFCYGYREEDLKKLLKSYVKYKRPKVQFKLVQWKITIE